FLYLGLLFRWTSEGRAAGTDPFFFTVLTVLAVSVDLIGKDGFRIMTKPAFIPFSRLLKCRTLVVVVPVKVFHQRKPFTKLTDTLAPNSVPALALPRTIGRT